MTKTMRARRRRGRGPGRPSAREAEQLPERLLEAAQAVFLEQGYWRTTMDAIARAAGVTRKTLYARFAGKTEVLTAVVNRLLDAALPAQEAGSRPRPPPTHDARRVLVALARELATLSATPQVAGLNRLIFAEACQSPDLARLFLDLHARATGNVGAALEALRDGGALPLLPRTDLAAVLFIEMVASLPRLRALLHAPLSRRETDELTAAAVDLFLRGCGGDRGGGAN